MLIGELIRLGLNVNALDNEASVITYLNSLKSLFENGDTAF